MKPVPKSKRVVGELSPVTLGSYGVVNQVSVLVSVADPASPMSLLQRQLRLEAEVGIGQLMPFFQVKTTPFSEQTQYNLAQTGLNRFNPLTEGFTEGFWRSVMNDRLSL